MKSPSPLISTLMVRFVPIFCVNKGESITVLDEIAWILLVKKMAMIKMIANPKLALRKIKGVAENIAILNKTI